MTFPTIKAWAFKRTDSEKWCFATVEPNASNLYLKGDEKAIFFELRTLFDFPSWAATQHCGYAWVRKGTAIVAIGHNPPSENLSDYQVVELYYDKGRPQEVVYEAALHA